MRPADRPYSLDHPAAPGKARRQTKNPLRALHVQLLPHEEKPIDEQLTQPFTLAQLREMQEREARLYQKFDTTLPPELLDINAMSSLRLMQVSGAMRSLQFAPHDTNQTTENLLSETFSGERWWQGGPDYSKRNNPSWHGIPVEPVSDKLSIARTPNQVQTEPVLAPRPSVWSSPTARLVITLLIGFAMLALVIRFVNIPLTLHILQRNLTTPRGILFACLASLSLASAYCIRGARWRLFLLPIGKVSLLKAIQLFWVAIFINFILPVQGGELAKSLMLKRISNIPVSQSLPTVAMDKALDLLPALLIMALVPFIPGIHMTPMLWVILGLVGGILIGIVLTIIIMALSRPIATTLIRFCLSFLPKGLAGKIESFAFGFIDSLLAGASRPRIFLPAILLTILAVTCDGLFALFSFWTVGVTTMTFWIAIFGYAVYTMFYILPTPPGHVGSNEFAGFIVFSQLLGFQQTDVTAMFIFSHPLGALIMAIACMLSLSGLGLSFSKAISLKHDSEVEQLPTPVA